VDPATDLVPLCANCHAIAHRRRTTVTSIEEIRALIEIEAAYGERLQRLTALKDRYDPTNFFRMNANFPPSGEGRRRQRR
jgi:hypothetical protein